jgi:transposase
MSEDVATWEPAVRPELWTVGARAAVERAYESADAEARTRAQMVLLTYEQGRRPSEGAALVRRSAVTVRRVLRRFAEEGPAAFVRGHGGGRAPAVTAAWEAELVRAVERRPREVGVASENWTTAALAGYLGEATGVRVKQEAVREHLHRLGYVCKRPTWTLERKAQEREDWAGNACGRSCS